MPEILKNTDGTTNWTAVIASLGAMLVLVLQQWQSYRIAEIQTQASVNKANFMDKTEVLEIEQKLRQRVEALEIKVAKLEKTNAKR